jgi:nicotinamidase-related amidase
VDPNTLAPSTTALVVFDMLECYRASAEQAGAIEPVVRLIDACRRHGVAICYARADHRPDDADVNRTITDARADFTAWGPEGPTFGFSRAKRAAGMSVLAEFAPQPEDYDIPKHRWNAFYGTHLDLSLRSRGVDTVLIVGGSTHVGVASTAYAARDMDYQVVVVSDGLTGFEPQRSFFVESVFPRMCRVRTVDQVLAMLETGGA